MAHRPRRSRSDDEDQPRKHPTARGRAGAPRAQRRGRVAARGDDDRGKKPKKITSRGRPPATRDTTDRRGGRDGRASRREGTDAPRADGRRGRPSRHGETQAPRAKQKRASRSTDDRNPTRSAIQYPKPKYRARSEPAPAVETGGRRPSLRTVRSQPAAPKPARATTTKKKTPARRRGRGTEAGVELDRIARRDASRVQAQLARAAEAYAAGRERDAARLLRPLRDAYPDATAVRELLGLVHYRLGQYRAAAKELNAFVAISDSVEQHPVLMDCARAMREYAKVEELWEELATSSPSGAIVTEGRIVLAGSLADRSRLRDAIDVLGKRADDVKRVQPHHLRLWYALADLHERAGDVPRARDLFERVKRRDPAFADVAERLVVLR
ncbi:MAG: tetratricopeptide repeat protein [Actinomycetota bacterium]